MRLLIVDMSRKPKEIAEGVCESGPAKVSLPTGKVLVLAVLAGAYIGFGGHLATVVSQDSRPFVGGGLTSILSGLVFSLGLILVVLGGAELFTGNSLLALPCLRGTVGIGALLRNWGIVYLGNLIGSLLLVALVFLGGVYVTNNAALGIREVQIANDKVNLGFTEALVRGILCNWLVCLAVWLATSADDVAGKILGIVFPITAFVASGFEHSVANMFLIPIGILAKDAPGVAAGISFSTANLTWAGFVQNLIPVTIGNIIGGAIFVGGAYWYVYVRGADGEKKTD